MQRVRSDGTPSGQSYTVSLSSCGARSISEVCDVNAMLFVKGIFLLESTTSRLVKIFISLKKK